MSSEVKPFFYKGFMSAPQWSEEDGLWYGKIDNVRDLVSYEGGDISEALRRFVNSVEDYVAFMNDIWGPMESRNRGDSIIHDILKNVEGRQ